MSLRRSQSKDEAAAATASSPVASSLTSSANNSTNTTHHRSSITPPATPLRPPAAVCIVVLGDIGRSPRMQYHARSLLEHGHAVDIVGYVETEPMRALCQDANAKIHRLAAFPETNLPRFLRYVFKTVWALLALLAALLYVRRPRYVLVQNPPAIPALIVCTVYCALTRARLVIDWHNYTHTILALEGGPDRCIVRMARWVESRFGAKSTDNLCVTRAMREDLRAEWGIEARVFHDRAAPQFQPYGLAAKHALFMRLAEEYPVEFGDEGAEERVAQVPAAEKGDGAGEEVPLETSGFTVKTVQGQVQLRADRPGLLVSSTSWTADEDFGVLLKALQFYEEKAERSPAKYPDLLCVITGRGPLRQHYLEIIERMEWTRVRVLTPWLAADDYPVLLAAADLGVCLHRSSSGLDLPMKVVDMFGCGLPVCAFNFECIEELVQPERNGFLFDDEITLGLQLVNWFAHYPNNISLVNLKETFQQNLRKFQALRWTENWNNVVWPVFQR